MLQTKITEITEAQKARFPEWVDKWVKVGLSTEEADFEKATKAALKAYEICSLEKPIVVLHVDSPHAATIAGAYAVLVLNEFFNNHEALIPNVYSIDNFKKLEKYEHILSKIRPKIWEQIKEQKEFLEIWDKLKNKHKDDDNLENILQLASDMNIASNFKENIKEGFNNYRGGSFWASWVAYVSFIRDVLGWDDPILENFKVDEDLTLSCGWIWWHENVLVISNRPLSIKRDEQGRLHDENEAAIVYKDGFSIYAMHGVSVPEYIIKNPEQITVQKIDDENNVEVRRIMMDKFGLSNYLTQSNATLVSKDRYGELYRKEIPNDEPLCMVKVIDAAPEADGSHKSYFLMVPSHMSSAHEAVAWTFGKTKEEYNPIIET